VVVLVVVVVVVVAVTVVLVVVVLYYLLLSRSTEPEDIECRLCDKVLHSPNELLMHLMSLMHRQNQPVL